MTQLFEIKEIEGKGLGWVATKNIKRGTVIFTEKPQLALNCCSEKQMESGNREIEFSHDLIEKVMLAFDQMSVSDQEEYLMLYNKFENLESLPPQTRQTELHIHTTLPTISLELSRENRLEVRKMQFHELLIFSDPDFRNPALNFDFGDHLRLMRQNKDKVEKMFKIYNIYETNTYSTSGVYLKISRINHSCRANAVFSKGEVRTVHKIKAGQEINLNYSMETLLTMKRQERQKHLLKKMSFVCSCDFCQNDCEDEMDFEFYEKILKVKNFPPLNPEVIVHQCRQLVDLYKEIYKIGKEKNMNPHILFCQLKSGFHFGYSGFLKTRDKEIAFKFEDDCVKFAKAAEKFHKILGNYLVDLVLWKKRQNLITYSQEKIEKWKAENNGDDRTPNWYLLKD